MRVLQVFGRMNRGGAESIIMDLYRNIDRSKIQFDFIVHTEEECVYDKEIRALGGNIYSVPRYSGKNHFSYVKAWEKFFEDHPEYNIIHGHIHSIASVYLNIAKKYGLTTICHSHTATEPSGVIGFIKMVYQRPLRNCAHWLFACSDVAGQWLYGLDCDKRDNYFVLKNAIDTEKYVYNCDVRNKVRKELGLTGKFVLGHVGRFIEAKNHMYLIDIFKYYHKNNPESVLLLVGDGELRGKIEKKIADEKLQESVVMTGVRSDVNELLQAMDCFVFPSIIEGLPVSVVEAQTTGLRCVVSNEVTSEVIITDLVEKMPINIDAAFWSEKIQKIPQDYERSGYIQEIVDAGYDIKSTASWLQDFYLNKC